MKYCPRSLFSRHRITGYRWPSNRQQYGFLFREPRVVDSTPPNNIIPLLRQKNATPWEIHAKPATDEHQDGRSRFASHPLQPLVTARMNAPLDLYRTGVTRIIDVLEMTEKPTSIQQCIIARIPYIHAVIHNMEYISINCIEIRPENKSMNDAGRARTNWHHLTFGHRVVLTNHRQCGQRSTDSRGAPVRGQPATGG